MLPRRLDFLDEDQKARAPETKYTGGASGPRLSSSTRELTPPSFPEEGTLMPIDRKKIKFRILQEHDGLLVFDFATDSFHQVGRNPF